VDRYFCFIPLLLCSCGFVFAKSWHFFFASLLFCFRFFCCLSAVLLL
jgi:hypothetical protein